MLVDWQSIVLASASENAYKNVGSEPNLGTAAGLDHIVKWIGRDLLQIIDGFDSIHAPDQDIFTINLPNRIRLPRNCHKSR